MSVHLLRDVWRRLTDAIQYNSTTYLRVRISRLTSCGYLKKLNNVKYAVTSDDDDDDDDVSAVLVSGKPELTVP